MLCLEIPGCVQHKIMYGVALWRDRSHYMDHMDRTHHNVEMLFARHYPQSSVGRRIDHSMSVTIAGAVQSLFHWPSWRPITSERWLIAGFGVVYTSACALVMSTYHEVLDVSSTMHSFALILLWCKVGPVGMPLSVRRSRL